MLTVAKESGIVQLHVDIDGMIWRHRFQDAREAQHFAGILHDLRKSGGWYEFEDSRDTGIVPGAITNQLTLETILARPARCFLTFAAKLLSEKHEAVISFDRKVAKRLSKAVYSAALQSSYEERFEAGLTFKTDAARRAA